MKIIKQYTGLLIFIFLSPVFLSAQSGEILTLTADNLKDDKFVELAGRQWKYRAGDDQAWAAGDFDDRDWETVEGTSIKPELLARPEWNGRAWFRLRVNVDESLADKNVAFVATQRGASEVYIDGRLLVRFGEITDTATTDYNPNRLPIPFSFGGAGEHTIAVRLAASALGDVSSGTGRWLKDAGFFPGFVPTIRDASDLNRTIRNYADAGSMRAGFLFGGILLALALLHLLLYLFYRVERANLFCSLYAGSFAFYLLVVNFRQFGHFGILATVIATFASNLLLTASFIGLLGFVHVAFGRRLGIVFWGMTNLWVTSAILNFIFLNRFGFLQILPNLLIGLSFFFCIYRLTVALRERRNGAWILFGGMQIFAVSMFITLMSQTKVFIFPVQVYMFGDVGSLLAVPIAVSVFLARNFARTSRDLQTQLTQVEQLSLEKIEQERQSAELRAENDRRAKELEEARQLQLSMLPKKLPQIPNLEIAAYMKPATEVGGDYYDFHVGADGTLTVAVGDATGHGLKAGTLVAATKSLFRAFANEKDITNIFRQSSQALKEMNLRGLFMAMTILKIKNNTMQISSAGMPSTLVYRAESKIVEELSIRAMPLGSVTKFPYQQQEISLSSGDCVVILSDGFPEMFNAENEMLGFAEAADVLPDIAANSSQEIISRFVKIGETWAGTRPQDDDVTFVVIKIKDDTNGSNL
jgi:serine phosphatase RsbU (regulator of sigma subunit)